VNAVARCECPTCAQPIEYDARGAEWEISCPSCSTPFLLPRGDSQPETVPVAAAEPLPEPERRRVSPALLKCLLFSGLLFAGALVAMKFKNEELARGIVIIGFGGAIYFLPSLVARGRNHRNESAIVLINLLLGWTLIGWVVALVWSVYVEKGK
jgi:hypothetical protein